MKSVRLGRTDISVVNAPLGAMFLGTKQDRDESFALLDYYVSRGGNFIDSANIYAHWVGPQYRGGESETVLGDWMKARGNRNNLVIATKVGFGYSDVPQSLAARRIKEECDKSLKRLGIDTIDLYFAHVDDLWCHPRKASAPSPSWCVPARCEPSAPATSPPAASRPPTPMPPPTACRVMKSCSRATPICARATMRRSALSSR